MGNRMDLCPTDLSDPATGRPLYVWVRRRPWWWPAWRRLALFCRLVWREDMSGGVMGVRLAWTVAVLIHQRDRGRGALGDDGSRRGAGEPVQDVRGAARVRIQVWAVRMTTQPQPIMLTDRRSHHAAHRRRP